MDCNTCNNHKKLYSDSEDTIPCPQCCPEEYVQPKLSEKVKEEMNV